MQEHNQCETVLSLIKTLSNTRHWMRCFCLPWLCLPRSSSSEVIDFERMDKAVEGALRGGGGAIATNQKE